ncbi:DUF6653 family protein [Nonomuraea sp. NPDC050227]|uniref:DUF6653 family protein n=1 Tax=Nonomuraea sp. NPDC050227 TaxID=3364360 RepID=UPI003791A909
MKLTQAAAATFGLDDEAWKRHANPWSVWTRMAGLAPILLPIYFREALGWWSLAPIAAGVIWMWLNPHAFAPVHEPRSWALWQIDRFVAIHEEGLRRAAAAGS